MKLQRTDIIFVLIQFILFFVYTFEVSQLQFTPPNWLAVTGITGAISGIVVIVIALLQLNKNLSPFPSPKSGAQLIQSGLYKYIRHPIYTGILLLFLGYSFYTSSGYKVLITLLLFILFVYKSRYEEHKLLLTFKDYSSYKKTTGRFLPKISR